MYLGSRRAKCSLSRPVTAIPTPKGATGWAATPSRLQAAVAAWVAVTDPVPTGVASWVVVKPVPT